MKRLIIIAISLAALLFTIAITSLVKNKNKLEPQKLCPVMDMEINKEVFLDYGGQRIFFCCNDCINKFKARPDAYLKKTRAPGSALASAPKMQPLCPVMQMKITPGLFIDHEGKRVYFCCPSCLEKFDADPAGYIGKMEAQGITFEKTPSLEHHNKDASKGEKHKHQSQH